MRTGRFELPASGFGIQRSVQLGYVRGIRFLLLAAYCIFGAVGRARTCEPLLRGQVLCPTELRQRGAPDGQ